MRAISLLAVLAIPVTCSRSLRHFEDNENVSPAHTARKIDNRPSGDGALPSIFIVGAQKGGSSSLFELMTGHPSFCSGDHKEIHYFDNLAIYEKGIEHYKQMFTDPKCSRISGARFIDGTPILHYPAVWQRIYDTYSFNVTLRTNLKFIVLLREPVAREYSWYQHTTRAEMHLGQSFDDLKTMNATYASTAIYFERGRYVEQLQAFTNIFRRDQLMVLSSVDTFKNSALIVERVRRFLNAPPHKSLLRSMPHDDHLGKFDRVGMADCIRSHIPALDCSLRDAMGEYFEPYNNALYSWLDETRSTADPNEPPFWPLFDSYKTNRCAVNAREEYDELLLSDLDLDPPLMECTSVKLE